LAAGGGAPGGAEEELHPGDVRDRYPSFSPDGKHVAFGDTRIGDQELWILDLETRRRQRLRLPQPELGTNFPFWSRDGRRIAVTQFQATDSNSIWLTSLDGSGAEELVPPKPFLRGGPFSPDGRNLLYTYRKDGFVQVFSLDLVNRQELQLTFSAGDKYDPIWSPDGRWAVYSSSQGGPCCQIWKIAAGGGEEQRLTKGYDRIRHLSFSPDGKWLYFQPNHLNICRIPLSGGPQQQVTKFPEAGLFLEEPMLSPDGKWLVYARNNGGSSLWLLELGSSPRSIQ
jgi:Tol biopolymer transport system component